MDIRFYNFEFELLYILPVSASDRGVISMNTTAEFNGCGSFELVFSCAELKPIVESNREHLIVVWRDFQGVLTGYRWSDAGDRLFGEHVNGLLTRKVLPKTDSALHGDVETLAYNAVSEHYDWLTLRDKKGFETQIDFWKNTYHSGSDWIADLLDKDGAGFKVTVDFVNKKYLFEVLKSEKSGLMISENNLNAYSVSESYDNKDLATGGWYEKATKAEKEDGTTKESSVWTYLPSDESKTGIYKKEVVLNYDSPSEAKNALKSKVGYYSATLKTKNITYGTDYHLGDVVRLQVGSNTVLRKVAAVNRWLEDEYGEEPVLKEVKDD